MATVNFDSFAFSAVAERSASLKGAAKAVIAAFSEGDGEKLAIAIAQMGEFVADGQRPSVTVTDSEIVVVTYARDQKILDALKGAKETTGKGEFRAFLGKRVPGSDAWRWTASRAAIEKYASPTLWAQAREVAMKLQAA